MTVADIERIASKFVVNQTTGCWDWIFSKDKSGYGVAWLDGRGRTVHRALYIAIYGELDDGLVLDHEYCDNRGCVNPHHLVPKSDWDNRRRSGWYGGDNECKRGHDRSKINTYTRPDGRKECRECRRIEMNRYYTKAGMR